MNELIDCWMDGWPYFLSSEDVGALLDLPEGALSERLALAHAGVTCGETYLARSAQL